jgi:hypothetical protein
LTDWVDFGVICALLLLNASVGFIQEYQAGSIVDELKKTLALKAVVLRDGKLEELEAPEIVPGDIVQIEEVMRCNCPPSPQVKTVAPDSIEYRGLLFLPTAAWLLRMPTCKSISQR